MQRKDAEAEAAAAEAAAAAAAILTDMVAVHLGIRQSLDCEPDCIR